MSFEDDLQRSFDTADSALELESGLLAGVKRRAARRTRNARMVAGAAAVVAVAVVGQAALRSDSAPIEVATIDDSVLADTSVPDDNATANATANADDPVSEESESTTEERPDESDFDYLGAFVVPAGEVNGSTFAFGGEASAFNPAGDPGSVDGFDGSLFMTGHPRQRPGVAEISIPAPEPHSGETAGLPVASIVHPFADITAGRGDDLVASPSVGGEGEFRYGGLEVVDGPEGRRLHWSIWQYNNVADNVVPGHGHSSLDLSAPDPQGPWFLGDAKNLQTAGYVLSVPESFAARNLGGRRLLAGYAVEPPGATGSLAPPFYSFQPPVTDAPNATISDVVELVFNGPDQPLSDYGRADVSPGAAWITTSSGGEAVITVGRRGLGEVREGESATGDCSPYAGIHADPYEPQILFYDPADLAAVAAGRMSAHEVEPYRRWNPAEHLIPTCAWFLSSVSFDPGSGRLYVVQAEADVSQSEFDPVPVVHVFQL